MITSNTKFFGLSCVLMLAVFCSNGSPGTAAGAEAVKVIFDADIDSSRHERINPRRYGERTWFEDARPHGLCYSVKPS